MIAHPERDAANAFESIGTHRPAAPSAAGHGPAPDQRRDPKATLYISRSELDAIFAAVDRLATPVVSVPAIPAAAVSAPAVPAPAVSAPAGAAEPGSTQAGTVAPPPELRTPARVRRRTVSARVQTRSRWQSPRRSRSGSRSGALFADIAGHLVTALLIVSLVVGWAALGLVVAEKMGYQSLSILTGSMTPNLPVGSLVFEAKVPAGAIAVGDVISFHPLADPAIFVTHRVLSVEHNPAGVAPGDYAVTKGDANHVPDPGHVILQGSIDKVVWSLPVAGYLAVYLQFPLVKFLLLVIPLLLAGTIVVDHLLRHWDGRLRLGKSAPRRSGG